MLIVNIKTNHHVYFLLTINPEIHKREGETVPQF